MINSKDDIQLKYFSHYQNISDNEFRQKN